MHPLVLPIALWESSWFHICPDFLEFSPIFPDFSRLLTAFEEPEITDIEYHFLSLAAFSCHRLPGTSVFVGVSRRGGRHLSDHCCCYRVASDKTPEKGHPPSGPQRHSASGFPALPWQKPSCHVQRPRWNLRSCREASVQSFYTHVWSPSALKQMTARLSFLRTDLFETKWLCSGPHECKNTR